MIIVTLEAKEGYKGKTLPYPKNSVRAKAWLFGNALKRYAFPEPREVKVVKDKFICDHGEFVLETGLRRV